MYIFLTHVIGYIWIRVREILLTKQVLALTSLLSCGEKKLANNVVVLNILRSYQDYQSLEKDKLKKSNTFYKTDYW